MYQVFVLSHSGFRNQKVEKWTTVKGISMNVLGCYKVPMME